VTRLADDLISRGFAVWNAEYRRLGEPGGGWPGIFLEVTADMARSDRRRFLRLAC
jgi:hypothetical protein